ncbi:MAG: response regulator transcription factor [Bacteroidales bacterium]|jgi:DNA-binding response OmpR family regulator|nr:response regulator transcription factor [Bacteroidales bacterium]
MNTAIKILLAEDDVNLGKVLSTYLEAKGYSVKHANNGEMAFELFCTNEFDICLVDVMMPLKDGFTLTREIRKMDKNIPIIFLTAKNFQEDMIEGLSIGGDDYITKPFSMEVLLARLQALLRRTRQEIEQQTCPVYQLGNTLFDVNSRSLTFNNKETRLTTREAEVLVLLIQKKNDVLEREFALKRIWGDDSYYNARSMDVYITKLRKYFKDDSSVQIINVHGIGFKLVV